MPHNNHSLMIGDNIMMGISHVGSSWFLSSNICLLSDCMIDFIFFVQLYESLIVFLLKILDGFRGKVIFNDGYKLFSFTCCAAPAERRDVLEDLPLLLEGVVCFSSVYNHWYSSW